MVNKNKHNILDVSLKIKKNKKLKLKINKKYKDNKCYILLETFHYI